MSNAGLGQKPPAKLSQLFLDEPLRKKMEHNDMIRDAQADGAAFSIGVFGGTNGSKGEPPFNFDFGGVGCVGGPLFDGVLALGGVGFPAFT
jgi:hypothetical protein